MCSHVWHRRHEIVSIAALAIAALLAVLAGSAPGIDTADAATAAPQPWSSPATWGGAGVPADGASVVIPAGKVVLLDRSVSLANLTIEGTLVFARRNLVLESDWIMVHGLLQVGTERTPFRQRAIIRLRDRTPGESIGHLGDKFIGLMGGRLELHGAPRRSWTRLVRTARAGQAQIVLATTVRWHRGDRIAIASTDFDAGQAEQRTIRAVRGRTLVLDRPLQYTHYGQLQRIAGRVLDERAEVALLTRNVRIEGDAASEATRFGGQVMAMDGSKMRIENVELTRMGQEGILLRYPIHFHMLGDAGAGSYVRQTSIHHTWNRCVTIHGTNAVRAVGNACFDHIGHGYFLEDGAERRNVLIGNLGFGTHRARDGKAILASDDEPGTFWITNPDNTVRGNVAAGSDGHGFWIALPEHPTGLFARLKPGQTRAMWPRRMKLYQFASNVAHSNDRDGLHFDDGPTPDTTTESAYHEAHANPSDEDSAVLVTTMTRLVAYKNRDHGVWLRGGEHRLVHSTLADNAIGATFANDESMLQNSFVVGESANVGTPASWEREEGQVGRGGRSLPQPWEANFPIRGFEFYDGRVGVEHTLFANFLPYTARNGARRQESAIGYHLDDDFSIHPRNYVMGLRFVRAKRAWFEPPEVGHDGDVSAVFLDSDGSLTGHAGRSLMTRNPFLYGADCTAQDDLEAVECTGDYASLIVGAPDTPAAMHPVSITRSDEAVQTLVASDGEDDQGDAATTTILTNATYRVAFTGGTPEVTRYVLYNGRDHWVKIAIPHGPNFTVNRYDCDAGDADAWCYGKRVSMAALDASQRTSYYYDSASSMLWLKLVSTDADWDEIVVE